MIDFHSHILPGIDDGASDVDTSIEMLRTSFSQGVDEIFATPHFYAEDTDPYKFIKDRDEAFNLLMSELKRREVKDVPHINLGCEVYFFPGMADAQDIYDLKQGDTSFLMIEMPFEPVSDYLLMEMQQTGEYLGLDIVVAHLDRYIRMFDDYSLIRRVNERNMYIQFNAKAFTDSKFSPFAIDCLKEGFIDFIGSDAHSMGTRRPNIKEAADAIRKNGAASYFADMNEMSYKMLKIQ